MTDFNWAQAIWNGSVAAGSLGGFCFMFKRWMDAREKREEETRLLVVKQTDKIAEEFQAKHDRSCEEIMKKIAENKAFYKESIDEVKEEVREVANLQRIANGRTGKIETRIAVLEQAHHDRVSTCGA